MGEKDVPTEQTAVKPEPADDRPPPLTAAAKAHASNGDGPSAKCAKPRPATSSRATANGDGGPVAKRAAQGVRPSNPIGGPAAEHEANGAQSSSGNRGPVAERVPHGAPPPDATRVSDAARGTKRSRRAGTATSPAGQRAIEAEELLALLEAAQKTVERSQARRSGLATPASATPASATPSATPASAIPASATLATATPASATPAPGPSLLADPDAGEPRADPDDAPRPPRDGLNAHGHGLIGRPPRPRPLPAERRAKLLAAIARSAEELAHAEAAPASAGHMRRHGKVARRVLAFGALFVPPAAAVALLMTHAAGSGLSRSDAEFITHQIVTADQRLRSQLTRVAANGTTPSLARAREANLTVRSLRIEVGGRGGAEASRLRRALTLQHAWVDAVGSTLVNPRSSLRDELPARDAAARAAIAALPGSSGRRSGGAQSLLSYARSRVRATSAGTP